MKFLKLAVVGAAMLAANTVAQAGPTFDNVKKKGFVQCGTNTGLAGFSAPDSKGVWSGLDIDMCRAIAAVMAKPNPWFFWLWDREAEARKKRSKMRSKTSGGMV